MSDRPPSNSREPRPELRLEGLYDPARGVHLLQALTQLLKVAFLPFAILIYLIVRTLGWAAVSLVFGLTLVMAVISAAFALFTLLLIIYAHASSWAAWQAFFLCSVWSVALAAIGVFGFAYAKKAYDYANAYLGRQNKDFAQNVAGGSEWIIRTGQWWNRPMKIHERKRRAEMDEYFRRQREEEIRKATEAPWKSKDFG